MSKTATPRRLDDTAAQARIRMLKISPQKLGLIAGMIRGKKASDALVQLEFSRRRVAGDVKKLLQSAIANAENNHGLDADRLYVVETYVGKDLVMKRFHARARGRASRIEKPFSNMTIIVGEKKEAE